MLKTGADLDAASASLSVSKGLGPAAIAVWCGRVYWGCESVSLTQRLLGGIVERGEERGYILAAAEAPVGEIGIWPDAAAGPDSPPSRPSVLGTAVRQGFTALAACNGHLAAGDKSGNVWLSAEPDPSQTAGPAGGGAEAKAAEDGPGLLLATTHWQGKRVTGVCLFARAGAVWLLSGSLDGTLHACRIRPRAAASATASAADPATPTATAAPGEAGAARVAEVSAPAGVTALALVGDAAGDVRLAVAGCFDGALCTVDLAGLPRLSLEVPASGY